MHLARKGASEGVESRKDIIASFPDEPAFDSLVTDLG